MTDDRRRVEEEPKLEGYKPVTINTKGTEAVFLIGLLLLWLIVLNVVIL